ncbi:cation efflux protein [Vibrio zhanjiangensis]|uniref:Cation efflux protein n=1 Tax=Vibrio zhanjiangensis TaxID=1046128 RepID=A0ABQ6F1C1_9VIBR|nr:cation diffusion facilitator family transporter [Vibrio zhanjiangensis]GLT18731.1 cation efflux protein [Vibrio zhanjiangensis]
MNGMSSERRLIWAMIPTGIFMFAEIIGGVVSGSLALLADAGHMLTDFAAMFLSFCAFKLSRRPPDSKLSYGYDRFQVLAAFVNGLTLFAIAGWIFYEAYQRIGTPIEVMPTPMLIIAVLGLVVNIVSFIILRGENKNLNIKSAAVHVMGDLLGSVAAIFASIVIMLTGWMPIDPILSVLVAVLILKAAYKIVKDSGYIILEGAPKDIGQEEVRKALGEAVPDVVDVHHIHIWSLTNERSILTLHASVKEGADHSKVLVAIKEQLEIKFGLVHSNIQLE